MEATAIAVRPHMPEELSVEQMIAQTQKIQQCMNAVMKKDEHYGVIPGTNTKPTLLKPGAEKLCLMFRLDPQYDILRAVETPELIAFTIRCQLFHIPTGNRIASGLGSCNSHEKKYLREAPKRCPNCSKETIFITKMENEPKYYCWKKKGGCGAKFKEGDVAIEGQPTGLEDPADLHNTILKMACKRSLVAAVLNGTAASDFFTQDVEDLADKAAEYTPPPQAKEGSAKKGDDGPILNVAETVAVTAASRGATATKATPTSGPTTTIAASAKSTAGNPGIAKPPRANTIKHDGTFASHKQVTLLHIMRSKVGGLVFCGDKDPCYASDGNKDVQVVKVLCAYHKQLAAFKDCDGQPITSSVNLSEDQISNLIDRYDAKIQQQERRASEDPDLGAAFDQAEENARIRGELGPGSDG